MAWQDTLAQVLGHPPGAPVAAMAAAPLPEHEATPRLPTGPRTPMDKMDSMDKTPPPQAGEGNSVHLVHSVHDLWGPQPVSSLPSPAATAEATSWPAPVQRAAVRLAAHLERRGASWGEAMTRGMAWVRSLHQRRGAWPRWWAEPGLDLSSWPAEARQEVEARAARLQAGGWAPPKARTLAAYITAGRRGLQLPGRVRQVVAGVASEATNTGFIQ